MDLSESTTCICCGIECGREVERNALKRPPQSWASRDPAHLGPHPHRRLPTPPLGRVGPSLSAKALTPPPRFGGETRFQKTLSLQPARALNELDLTGLGSSVLRRSQHRPPCAQGPSPHLCSPSLGGKQELWLGPHADLPCPLRPPSSRVTSGKQGASGSVLVKRRQ